MYKKQMSDVEEYPVQRDKRGSVAIRWVLLTAVSFWAGLLLRDVFGRTWSFMTGLDRAEKNAEEYAKYKKSFPKYIGLQVLLLFIVLTLLVVMATYWDFVDTNGYNSFNV